MQERGKTRVQRLKKPRAGRLTSHNIASGLKEMEKRERGPVRRGRSN